MRALVQTLFLILSVGFSFTALAANIPSDCMGAKKYDAIKCVADATQNCINSVCLTSSERNCQGSCEKMAQQKCRQQANE
ncbi:hypothetical protein TUM19329_32240 [Legionella antarctica]|uniref:Uncharacterized protein n=1 Tax=Legionella antarctica TaxID=2708020 RepID=A0A6F8T9E9_9GAMM|nr:hypothetical protein [Legionella antarctica]BCA96863.1 hypothetical protein TUM19329_32240 [Legionella antarctica]